MACSKYEYVKDYEQHLQSLPNVYLVVRIDGKAFTKFSKAHQFEKPNDAKALEVMNLAAQHVMSVFPEIILAYGQSDEYSFVIPPKADPFNRRNDKIVSNVVSAFTSCYVFSFQQTMGRSLESLPVFDGRVVQYPSLSVLRDYLSWRQVDCHINNLYNTAFWALVHKGHTNRETEEILKKTLSEDKHQLLFELGINYNNLPAMFRKGSVLVRRQKQKKQAALTDEQIEEVIHQRQAKEPQKYKDQESIDKLRAKMKGQSNRAVQEVVVTHEDLIGESFWEGW